MPSDASLYYEKQRFNLKLAGTPLAIPPVAMLALTIWQVVLGHPWGKQPISNGNLIGWTIFLWIILFRLLTVRLVTEVRQTELVVKLRGLWRARRIPVKDIQSMELATFHPLRDYGGYGIRTSRTEKAYLANGDRGVRLTLADGAKVLIGSQKPEELQAALSRLRSSSKAAVDG